MRKLWLTLALIMLSGFMMAGSANAASIEPSLPPAAYPVYGEAELSVVYSGTTYLNYIDWAVYGPGSKPSDIDTFSNWQTAWGSISDTTGYYIYLYQLENKNVNSVGIDEFAIQPLTAQTVLGTGWINGYDLDTVHSLTGEYEPTTTSSTPDNVYTAEVSVAFGKAEWNFSTTGDTGVFVDSEAETMWLVSTLYPAYYPAKSNNGIPDDLRGTVPAPAPEPASLSLLGLSLLGIGSAMFRRKFMA